MSPYKNTGDRMKRQQERRDTPDTPTGDTPINDTPISDTPKLLSRPNMMKGGVMVMQDNLYNPAAKLYDNPYYSDGTPRYLGPLSDNQVLDRLTVACA